MKTAAIKPNFENIFVGTKAVDYRKRIWIVKQIIKPSGIPAKWNYVIYLAESGKQVRIGLSRFERALRII